MLKKYNTTLMTFFFCIDIALTEFALWLADRLRHHLNLGLGKPISPGTVYLDPLVYAVTAVIWVASFRIFHIYASKRSKGLFEELASVGMAVVAAVTTLAAWLFIFDYDDFSRLLLGYFGVLNLFILLGFHLIVRLFLRFLRQKGYNLKRVVIVGAGKIGRQLAMEMKVRRWTGFEVVGFVDDNPAKQSKSYVTVPVLGRLDEAERIAEQYGVDEVIITLPSSAHQRIVEVVRGLQRLPLNIRVVPDLFEIISVRARVEDLWGIPVIGVRQPVMAPLDAIVKRVVDLMGALVGIALFWPVMLIVAICIKLDSRGPMLFVQERVGENGRPFKMYKFRTMVANAEQLLDELVDLDVLEEPVFKIKDDPRVTRVGRFLRRISLDELPQLFNVLKGEMSLVGPRPEEAEVVRRYSIHHRKRLAVKPGITGPMQVNGRGDLTLQKRLELELDYIENYSLVEDFKILFKTVPVLVNGKGSY